MKRHLLPLPLLLLLTGCQPSLQRQPKLIPFREGSARPLPEGVVARETPDVPQRPTLALLQAGQKLYAIHCSVCHGWTGYGDGIAVQRGFPRVESLHSAKGRGQSVAEVEDVIAHGRGKMFAMDNRLDAAKRRKIAFYVQALRLSRHFPTADLKPEQLRQVREAR